MSSEKMDFLYKKKQEEKKAQKPQGTKSHQQFAKVYKGHIK
jgi:hypothetical protein